MLRKPSKEWDNYMKRLSSIKQKSNREVLWTDCWMILNYEQRGKHASKFQRHRDSILTSSQFASEIQFYQIAFQNNKVFEKEDDIKLVIQPWLFDPKKGSGQIKMLEELCREMHGNQDSQDKQLFKSLDADKNWDNISQGLSEPDSTKIKIKCSTSGPKSSEIESLSSSIDKIVTNMNELCALLTSWMSTQKLMHQSINNDLKIDHWNCSQNRRKLSESEPSVQDPTYPSDSCNILDPISPKPVFRMTAFSPYSPSTKFKPVPLPTLNSIVSQMQSSLPVSF